MISSLNSEGTTITNQYQIANHVVTCFKDLFNNASILSEW